MQWLWNDKGGYPFIVDCLSHHLRIAKVICSTTLASDDDLFLICHLSKLDNVRLTVNLDSLERVHAHHIVQFSVNQCFDKRGTVKIKPK